MSNSKLNAVFAITKFFDEGRWGKTNAEKDTINFHNNSLSDDEKLLTHWLCYITERQMPYQRIWNVGAFIFSQIVQKMSKTGDISSLKPSNQNLPTLIKRSEYPYKKEHHFKEKDYDKYVFVSSEKVNENKRLPEYGFEKDTQPYFISRYYPADYKSIIYTFVVLEKHDNSLIKYITSFLDNYYDVCCEKELDVRKLLFSLYLLTYHDVKQPNAAEIDFSTFKKDAKERRSDIEKRLTDPRKFKKQFDTFSKDQIYNQKRAWCALRDFFKSPEIRSYFYGALLENRGFANNKIAQLKEEKLLCSLELPGDVWNNNPKFRKCILSGTDYADSKKPMAKLLREFFDNQRPPEGYPEQFDITFDFVPSMCEQDACDICPYGILNNKTKWEEFNLVCTQCEGKYCPVLLRSCRYKYICNGENCSLLKTLKRYGPNN